MGGQEKLYSIGEEHLKFKPNLITLGGILNNYQTPM